MRSRFVEIYGAKPELRERFEGFADSIARDERVEVKTLSAAADGLAQRAKSPQVDLVPVV